MRISKDKGTNAEKKNKLDRITFGKLLRGQTTSKTTKGWTSQIGHHKNFKPQIGRHKNLKFQEFCLENQLIHYLPRLTANKIRIKTQANLLARRLDKL
jgi:tRNA A22 N-methylase